MWEDNNELSSYSLRVDDEIHHGQWVKPGLVYKHEAGNR